MSVERSEEVMRRYLTEVLAERKLELLPEIAAEDMVDHTQTIPGRAGLEKHAGGFLASRPDVEIEVERIIASEDSVVGIWTWRATHTHEMFGVAPTGRKVEMRVASVFKLRDGMLIDYEVFADRMPVLTQMGAEVKVPTAQA